jgi:hypothetical protein
MNLNPKQRVMLANAKSYIATVSRQAELAKDLPMAHALADVVAELHRVMTIVERFGRPAKVLKLKRPS